ncbi:hypothetical protein ACIBH1_39575 [Nonomuraea sp. NPDC050663]|uniref:hypothetical protein n=1 Tax=Nonomuraea sp. NPDC050663 TaxID=3364370 RepID=UPI00183D69FC|nr:hypothetical protein [Thermoactinospora sp.]
MKKTLTLGLVAAALVTTGLATSSSAATVSPAAAVRLDPAPLPEGVTTITDQILDADRTLRGPGLRSRYNLWVVGIHGTATVRDKDSKFINYTWQRGTLTAKTATTVTVTSKDGYVQTWALHTSTRFRRAAKPADLTKLVVGDGVFAIGVPGAAGPTAAAVFVPKNRAVLEAPAVPGS